MQRLTVCVDCAGKGSERKQKEENNDDESLHQLEEGTKDGRMEGVDGLL